MAVHRPRRNREWQPEEIGRDCGSGGSSLVFAVIAAEGRLEPCFGNRDQPTSSQRYSIPAPFPLPIPSSPHKWKEGAADPEDELCRSYITEKPGFRIRKLRFRIRKLGFVSET